MSDSPTENLAPETDTVVEASDVNSGSSSEDKRVEAEVPAPESKADKPSLADSIKAAVDRKAEEASPASDTGTKVETSPEGENTPEAEEDRDFTDEEINRLHSKTRKQIKRLLGQKKALADEVNQFKPAAEAYNRIDGFLKSHEISLDDANDAFEILADMRRSPEKALERLEKLVTDLRLATGRQLPADLDEQVRAGYMTEATAREQATLRRENAALKTTREQEQQRAQQEQARQRENEAKTVLTAISAWENTWKASDPDYQKKQNDVRDEFELALARAQREGKTPRTVEAVNALLDACRKRVEGRIMRFQPPKQEMRHVSGGGSAVKPPQPRNSAEAILYAVNR